MNAAIGKRPVEPLGTSWQDRASCRREDPELFFGPEGEQRPDRELREARAKAVCAVCPVRAECLAYAEQRARYGVYGGLTDEERGQERKREQQERRREQRRESYHRTEGARRASGRAARC